MSKNMATTPSKYKKVRKAEKIKFWKPDNNPIVFSTNNNPGLKNKADYLM